MKTSTWIILGVVAVVGYYMYTKKDKTEVVEEKAGFISAKDKIGNSSKLGTLSKNGL
jgi:cbb3-type cytochrome oxidase subunit 3